MRDSVNKIFGGLILGFSFYFVWIAFVSEIRESTGLNDAIAILITMIPPMAFGIFLFLS